VTEALALEIARLGRRFAEVLAELVARQAARRIVAEVMRRPARSMPRISGLLPIPADAPDLPLAQVHDGNLAPPQANVIRNRSA